METGVSGSAAASSQSGAPFHLSEATIASVHAAMQAGQLTCRQLVQLYIDRIAAYDKTGPGLNSIMTVNPRALEEADRFDAELRTSGLTRPLQGIPVLIKDQFETSDMPTTYGSALFKNFVPQRNATMVEKLKAAGALILAKNTMSEYAQPGYYGSAFGFTRNPYDLARSPGGSSCGTAVAVAANLGVVGIGEDTGGSIRNPASATGLVGLRPTMGLVSRFGMMPGSPSRDTLGPMTRTVTDAAILLAVIHGYDPNDPATAFCYGHAPPTYSGVLTGEGLRGTRLGVIREPLGTNINSEATDYRKIGVVFDRALGEMADSGADIMDAVPVTPIVERLLRLPFGTGETEEAIKEYLAAHPNAPARTLQDIVLAPDGMVHPGQRAALAGALGHVATDPAYLQARLIREELRQEVYKVMADHGLSALVYPTMLHYQPSIPDDIMSFREPDARSGSNSSLSPAIGFPALTVPAGHTDDGLPVGISFLGRPFTEGLLFAIAHAYEQSGLRREPPLTAPELPGEP